MIKRAVLTCIFCAIGSAATVAQTQFAGKYQHTGDTVTNGCSPSSITDPGPLTISADGTVRASKIGLIGTVNAQGVIDAKRPNAVAFSTVHWGGIVANGRVTLSFPLGNGAKCVATKYWDKAQ